MQPEKKLFLFLQIFHPKSNALCVDRSNEIQDKNALNVAQNSQTNDSIYKKGAPHDSADYILDKVPPRTGWIEKKKDTAGEKLEIKIPPWCYQHQSVRKERE